jgi:oligopeptidase B
MAPRASGKSGSKRVERPARLRTLKTDAHPLLLVTNMQAGHGGASGRYDYLKEIALDYAFVLRELGIV